MKRFFTRRSSASVAELSPVERAGAILVPLMDEIVGEFYLWILAEESRSGFFRPHDLDRVKTLQTAHWIDFFESPVNEAYNLRRRHVGIVHANIGLPATLYLEGLDKMAALFRSRLEETVESGVELRGMTSAIEAHLKHEVSLTLAAYATKSEEDLEQISRVAEAVADGDLDVTVQDEGEGDLLARSLNRMVATLKDASRQVNVIASGDYTAEIAPRSEKDELGLALVAMTLTLRDVSRVAEAVADGELDVTVREKGESDLLARSLNRMVATLKDASRQANVIASGDYTAEIAPRSDKDELGLALAAMTGALRQAKANEQRRDWHQAGVARLNEVVLGEDNVEVLASSAVAEVAAYLDAQVGALYTMGDDPDGPQLHLLGTFAYTRRKNLSNRFRLGEGLVGQAALEQKQIIVRNVPDDYIRVVSGLGEAVPRHICVTPILFEESVQGVMEIGTLLPLGERELTYLKEIATPLATAFAMARSRKLLRLQQEELRATNEELQEQARSLEQSQQELQAQQAELEATNVELETQVDRVRESERRLQEQQRETEVVNATLASKNELLEEQKKAVERARSNLASQAENLARASKYKSEFLANMSHELRTPLNSLLLLARSLRDNGERNLTEDQVESATVIFDSGSDLLNLINEILDLSKIEAGQVDLRLERVEVEELVQTIRSQFDHMAASKGLALKVRSEPDAPGSITTDPQRLGQVVKNLLANALKFTDEGSVTVAFGRPVSGTPLARRGLEPGQTLAIRVTDTGIGISEEQREEVFEAFRQADSGDRKRYGGTGLGLTISRDLVALLGGEIELESEVGVGSTFTVFLPLAAAPGERVRHSTPGDDRAAPASTFRSAPSRAAAGPPAPAVEDDRDDIGSDDRAVLLVEDDERFAKILRDRIRERGLKCLVAVTGEEGLELASLHRPLGIVLDIGLPHMDGWAVLSELKQNMDTRHIPVHIASVEPRSPAGMRLGAIGHVTKPVDYEDIADVIARIERASSVSAKRVLVVEDDPVVRRDVVRVIGNGAVTVVEAETGQEAMAALRGGGFDLVVLDLGLPDVQGLDVLESLTRDGVELPPVIINTVRAMTLDEETALRRYSDSFIVKDVRSHQRLVDEITLFLHRVVRDLPEDKREVIRLLHESDEPIRGKKVLIVEDDMRTLFAMTKIIAEHGMVPVKAENGERALTVLEAHPDIDIVLMDMMMPVMDGYEAARRIRAQDRFTAIPILALTAKAMKEDRARCLEAGATDYMSKPIDPERLVSLMRVWLSR